MNQPVLSSLFVVGCCLGVGFLEGVAVALVGGLFVGLVGGLGFGVEEVFSFGVAARLVVC